MAAETAPKPQPPKSAAKPNDRHAGHPRIFLIDAMSFIFRAYHAMARQRPMSTSTGIPTGASYVFINMLRKLVEDFHPEYIAAVFDVAGPTFRDVQAKKIASFGKFDMKTQTFTDQAYGGYKAQRAEMPLDLAQQIPYIRRALEAFRIPILESPGYEADDVIGTLARQAAEQSHPVYVVSSDKDMLQLVNDKVCVLNPPKDNLICDAPKVQEILGVPPERVIDVMALRGDSIDNVPGAPGIGDKGSVELIQRFGSLEQLLAHAEEVQQKRYRESLLQYREQILWSKQLVTIDCDVPIELDLNAMKAAEPDVAAARTLFTELEFTSLIKEFGTGIELGEAEYREALSADDVKAALAARDKESPLAIAFGFALAAPEDEEDDAEAEENQTGELSFAAPAEAPPEQVAISTAPARALTVNLDGKEACETLKKAFGDASLPKAVHDYKAAVHALRERKIELAGVRHEPMLYSFLLNPTYSSHTLPEVVLRHFNVNISEDARQGARAPANPSDGAHAPSRALAQAADLTGRLATSLSEQVDQAGLRKVYDEIDLPLVPVLARMEEAGIKIDCDVLREMSTRLETQCDAKSKQIYAAAKGVEFNINSPKQLGDVLFNQLGLPVPVKYGKGKKISTAQDVLENLAAQGHDVPRLVLEYRQLSKLKSTYVDALPTLLNQCTQRLHTTFDQTNAVTGRLSSKNPNLQNIPIRTELGREIRAAFIAEPGCLLLSADYSQIELRLLAHFSEDQLLLEAFRRGDDIHTQTAAQVFGVPPLMVTAEHRRRAKAVNFGIVYGQTPFGLAQTLGIEQGEARQFIDAYFEKYTGVRKWLDAIKELARREKKVSTMFGRVRPIPDIDSKNPNLRGFAERTAMNTPLQGTAADLIKVAMIRLDEELRRQRLKSRMLLQVHDELVFEAPEDEIEPLRALVKERMEQVHPLKVPLAVEVGVGKNWRDME